MVRPLGTLAALALATTLTAQGPAPQPPAPGGKPTSNPMKELVRADLAPAEVGTPGALATSLYAFISGPTGQKRELEKIRALFHPAARIMVAARHPEKGAFLRPLELEGFLGFAIPQWEKGFFERSTGLSVQVQDGVAQVWSPYEIRLSAEGPVQYTGVNALQCGWDGKRWWITHLEFQSVPAPGLAGALPPR